MSAASVRAMVHWGQLPVVKHRRIFRFLRSDVETTAAHFANAIGTAKGSGVLCVSEDRLDHWITGGLFPAEKRGGFYRVGLMTSEHLATHFVRYERSWLRRRRQRSDSVDLCLG